MPADRQAMIEAGREQFKQRVRREYGRELRPGPFGVDSYPALVLAKFAEAQGRGPEYHRAAGRAYWEQGQRLDDPAVLQAVLTEIGLAIDDIAPILADPTYTEAVAADITEAHELGLNAVPALVFAEKYLVSGAQPYSVLKQVVEQVASEMAAESENGDKSE